MILSTAMQGVPFAVAGCADLLALFRCVSCRFKFGTDTAKPALMVSVCSLVECASHVMVTTTLSEKMCKTPAPCFAGSCGSRLHVWQARNVAQYPTV